MSGSNITRRLFLRAVPPSIAAAGALVVPPAVEAAFAPDLEAIPADIVVKVRTWQAAHRAAVKATKAYSSSLNVKPIDKPLCDRCFYAMSAANKEVGPAREAMILALGMSDGVNAKGGRPTRKGVTHSLPQLSAEWPPSFESCQSLVANYLTSVAMWLSKKTTRVTPALDD